MLSGNEVGVLLADWVWQNFRRRHPDVKPEDCVMLSSTVSSVMLAAMAAREGFYHEETLTGFKWMGTRAHELTQQGKRFVFAYEEAIGYMISDVCRDKDGVRAAATFAEMYHHLRAQSPPLTPLARLRQLHERYGYFVSHNHYYFCYEPSRLRVIFDKMRAGGEYLRRLGEFDVRDVRDLTTGFDSRTPDKRPRLPVSSSTEMITFYLKNGGWVTLRGSGTEPKLKFYVELSGPLAERARLEEELARLVSAVIAECLRPEEHALQPPADPCPVCRP